MKESSITEPETAAIHSFGAGCFRFSYWDSSSSKVTSDEIVAAVRKALEALPALNNLEIEPPMTPNSYSPPSKERPVLEEGEAVISYPLHGPRPGEAGRVAAISGA